MFKYLSAVAAMLLLGASSASAATVDADYGVHFASGNDNVEVGYHRVGRTSLIYGTSDLPFEHTLNFSTYTEYFNPDGKEVPVNLIVQVLEGFTGLETNLETLQCYNYGFCDYKLTLASAIAGDYTAKVQVTPIPAGVALLGSAMASMLGYAGYRRKQAVAAS